MLKQKRNVCFNEYSSINDTHSSSFLLYYSHIFWINAL